MTRQIDEKNEKIEQLEAQIRSMQLKQRKQYKNQLMFGRIDEPS